MNLDAPASLAASVIGRRRYVPATAAAAAIALLARMRPEYDLVHAPGMFSLPAGAVARQMATAWGIPTV